MEPVTAERGGGKFVYAHWCGGPACEAEMKDETKATIRCIPLAAPEEQGACLMCGGPSSRRVIMAKSY